jgi:hypothetical protein
MALEVDRALPQKQRLQRMTMTMMTAIQTFLIWTPLMKITWQKTILYVLSDQRHIGLDNLLTMAFLIL